MNRFYKLILYTVCGAVAIWLTVKLLLPIALPFLLGLLLARLAEPPARFLRNRWKFYPAPAAYLSVTLVSAVLLLLLYLLGRGIFAGTQTLVKQLPAYLSSLEAPLAALQKTLLSLTGRLPPSLSEAAAEWVRRLFEGSSVLADTASQWLMNFAGTLLSLVPQIILFLLTMLLSAYLLSSDRKRLRDCARCLLPQAWTEKLRSLLHRLKKAVGGYCKAQLLLILVTFGILCVGFFLLRRKAVLLPAVLIAVIDALPVFGVGTVLIPWSVLSFLQGDSFFGVGLLLLYAAAAITRTVLEPRFLGRQIGLHPLLTLVSLYAGYRLFGIVGMILVPIGVILLKQLYDLAEPLGEK